jgi:hypothetical protein
VQYFSDWDNILVIRIFFNEATTLRILVSIYGDAPGLIYHSADSLAYFYVNS